MMHLVMEDFKSRKSILDKDWDEEERKNEAARIITRTLRRHSQNKMKQVDNLKDKFNTETQNKKKKSRCPLLKNIFYAVILVLIGGTAMSLIEFPSAAQKIET